MPNHNVTQFSHPMSVAEVLDEATSVVLERGWEGVVCTRPTLTEVNLRPGVEASRLPIRGRRVVMKGPRSYGNRSFSLARWPTDGLEGIRVPMLVYVARGFADLRLADYVLHCERGTLLFLPTGLPHTYGRIPSLMGERLKDGFCDLMWISHRGPRLHCWMDHSVADRRYGPHPKENLFLHSETPTMYLRALAEELEEGEAANQELRTHLLLTLLMHLQRDIQFGRFMHLSGELVPNRTGDFPAEDAIGQAQHYIRANLSKPLTLESVARVVSMSRGQFSRRFREETGETFVEFTQRHRLELAVRFLRESDWSIPYISEFVGFKSPSYFHRLFLSRFGMPPNHFRSEERKENSNP